ncbi:MAG: heavy-metal-associated domain-containing protein [Thiobacillaceae bacterium]|nr:heavy-metal-associated domain-containing protein [Thiobacillaceae bacterium]MCX7672770.1 heavy-metal-associated domain-containing protein [Thiobacillaceae bacterium]MDW8323212.1 hypothetical protein [Burkholderiales bacterium]
MPLHGTIDVVHFIPGRVRLRAAGLKGRPQLAQQLQAAFAAVPGVKSIEVNTLTGSVLITYDPRRILAEDGGERLRSVLREELPDLDAEQILRWLGGPLSSF